MATAKVLIERALRVIGVLEGGNQAQPHDIADGLTYLNELLRSWELKGVMVPTVEIVTFSLTNLKRDYTWGAGGDLDGPRPSVVISIVMADAGGTIHPTREIDGPEWLEIGNKTIVARPRCWWLDNGHPLRTLRFDAYPIDAAMQAAVRGALPTPATVTADVILHPGYESAIRFNLACNMAPEFGKEVTRDMRRLARESLSLISSANITMPTVRLDGALTPGCEIYNIRSGP